MSIATTPTTTPPPPAPVAQVRVTGGGLQDDIRAIRTVWKRELIRTYRNRLRIVTSLAQPIIYLFVLGSGLSPIVSGGGGHVNFKTFMFPGVIAMTVLFTALFSAISIVWDREFGFLREMLVAPVRRSALVTGKCLGGATVASFQGLIILVLAPLAGVPYRLALLGVMLMMILAAVSLTAFGILLASRMQQLESFQVVTQFIVLPMFFLSGALFPLTGVPVWLGLLAKLDPLAYAIAPMRGAVFSTVTAPPEVMAKFNHPMTWNGWPVPTWLQLLIVAVLGFAMLALAVRQFSKPE